MSRGYFRPPLTNPVDLGAGGEISIGSSAGEAISILNSDDDVAALQRAVVRLDVLAKGTMGVTDRVHGIYVLSEDRAGVANKTVTNAVTNGGLIRLTATAHGLTTGHHVAVYGVGGTVEANSAWVVTVIDANTIDLQGSTFTNAYTSGGTVTNRPMMFGVFSDIKPAVGRGSLTGTAANGDDLNAFVAYNSNTTTQARGTDAYYLGHNTTFGAGQAEWATAFACDANVLMSPFQFAGRITGAASSDCAIFNAGAATIDADAYAMRVPNNGVFAARNAANNANVNMFRLNTSDRFQVDAPTTLLTGSGTVNLIIQDVATNSVDKVVRVTGGHYTNSEEPVGLILCTSATSSSVLSIGGGAAAVNAVTGITFYTAASTTTTTGTLRLTIGSSGILTFAETTNLAFGTTTGTKVGTATTQKIGFWNATPVVQPTAVADASGGAVIDAEARTALNALLSRLRTIGVIA